MSLFTKPMKHGHNVHDGRRGIRNNDAHESRRRAVLVHRRDHPDFARACSGRVRGVGHPRGASLLPFRSASLGRKIKECAKVATAVLIGLSFASPAFALDTIFDNTNEGYTDNFVGMTYNWNNPSHPECSRAQVYVNLVNHSDQDWLIYRVVFPQAKTFTDAGLSTQFNYNPTAQIYTTSTVWHGVANTTWTPTSSPRAIDFSSPAIIHAGEEMGMTIDNPAIFTPTSTPDYRAQSLLVQRTTSTVFGDSTGGVYAYLRYSAGCGLGSGPVVGDPYGPTPVFRLEGYGADLDTGGGGSTSTTPIPTSTYDGTFSGSTPSLSWSVSGTPSISATYYSQKFAGMFGATSSFPLCVVDPFINLVDVIHGATLGNQPSASLVIAGAMGSGTSTFSLGSASSVAASVGLRNITDLLFPFLEACAWLGLGVYIFRDLFAAKEEPDTL